MFYNVAMAFWPELGGATRECAKLHRLDNEAWRLGSFIIAASTLASDALLSYAETEDTSRPWYAISAGVVAVAGLIGTKYGWEKANLYDRYARSADRFADEIEAENREAASSF